MREPNRQASRRSGFGYSLLVFSVKSKSMSYRRHQPGRVIVAGVIFALLIHAGIWVWEEYGKPTSPPFFIWMLVTTHCGWMMNELTGWPDKPDSLGNLLLNSVYWPLLFTLISWGRHRWRLRNVAEDDILCEGCGYNLLGNTSGVCPECGTATQVGGAVE